MGAHRAIDARWLQGQARAQNQQPAIPERPAVDGPERGSLVRSAGAVRRLSNGEAGYYDWVERGVLAEIFQTLSADIDLKWLSVDATVVRAHQHAAGARKEKGGLMPRGWAAPAAA